MAGGKNIYSPEARQPQRFEFKAGTNGFQWKGNQLEGDPSSIPPNKLRVIINGRMVGGMLVDRSGFAEYSGTDQTVPGCVFALFDAEVQLRMYYGFVGCGSLATGGTLKYLDQDGLYEDVIVGSYYATVDTFLQIAEYGESVVFSVLGKLKRFTNNSLAGTTGGVGEVRDSLIYDFTGTDGKEINFLRTYEGNLYIGVVPPAGNGVIWKYDGVTMSSDLSSTDLPQASCLWREFLVVGFDSGANHIRYRNSAGTWTTVNPAAGTIQVYNGTNAMVSYKDVVYMAEGPSGAGTARIWSYDGTTLQVARTPATATFLPVLAVMNGYLYYAWTTGAVVYIGRFDGTTWIDQHKNITAQFSNARSMGGLHEFRGQLFLGLNDNKLVASPGLDTSGTWLGTNPTVTGTGKTLHSFTVI